MRFQLISDVHGRFSQVRWDPQADLVLAAGDISENLREAVAFLGSAPVPVLYVAGNHEHYGGDLDDRTDELRRLCARTHGHITFLERETVHFQGTRILGATLWSDFGGFSPLLVDAAEGLMNDYLLIGLRRRMLDPDWRTDMLALNQAQVRGRRIAFLKGGVDRRLIETQHQRRQQAMLRRLGLTDIDDDSEDLENLELAARDTEHFSPAAAFLLHRQTTYWLERELAKPFDGPTVVMTHHAPSRLALSLGGYMVEPRGLDLSPSLPRRSAPYKIAAYTSSIESLAARHKVDAWCHGHFHEPMRYRMGEAAVYCNPTGHRPTAGGVPTFSFGVDERSRMINLLYLLGHTQKVLYGLHAWFLQALRNPQQMRLIDEASVIDAVWREAQVPLVALGSLPATELPDGFRADLGCPLDVVQRDAHSGTLTLDQQQRVAQAAVARLVPVHSLVSGWHQRVGQRLGMSPAKAA